MTRFRKEAAGDGSCQEGCLWKAGRWSSRPGARGRQPEIRKRMKNGDRLQQPRHRCRYKAWLANQQQRSPVGTVPAPGSGLLRGHTPGGAGSSAAAQTEGTRDVLKPLSARTPAGWWSRLPLGAGPRGIPGCCCPLNQDTHDIPSSLGK